MSDESEAVPVPAPRSKRALRGVIVGASFAAISPLLGLGLTVLMVQRAFDSVERADPSEKARMLAEGISNAMNCLALGIGGTLVGMLVLGISLFLYLRNRPSDGPHASPDASP
jgi:biopolymer transport protein ExbB/TolQ